MKQRLTILLMLALLAAALLPGTRVAHAQDEPPTSTPGPSARPLVVVSGYSFDRDIIRVGEEFTLHLDVKNNGAVNAKNLVFTFNSPDILPQDTGGLAALNTLEKGKTKEIKQSFTVAWSLWGQPNAVLPVNLTYTDEDGNAYSAVFNITLRLTVTPASAATATPTTAPLVRPQMMVRSYATDADPLQPGTIFNLSLQVNNMGSGAARAVTMVIGGGAASVETGSGTPQPGGLSGGSGELSVFAPLGSSNLFYVGDVETGKAVTLTQKLIVNVSANPGAYVLKISFVYNDVKGNRLVDDQVITLLVYQLPQVEVNFYRDPGMFFTGQPGPLPLQVTNLGRKSTVLGNLKVTAANAEVTNNVALVGALEPGGYFTLDANLLPQQPGPLDLTVTINYTDDFNQARTITQNLSVTAQEAPVIEPPVNGQGGGGGGGMEPLPAEETLLQKVVRFIKGLVGLDSGPTQTVPVEGAPTEEVPGPVKVVPGGKG